MGGKFQILLWKEKTYRSIFWTSIGIILPVLMVILTNLKYPVECYVYRPKLEYHYGSTFKLPKNLSDNDKKYINRSDCRDGDEYVIAYEPSNDFVKTLVSDAVCIATRNRFKFREGLDKDYKIGFKFSGISNNNGTTPNFLEYEIHPTEFKTMYPSGLWEYGGSMRLFDVFVRSPGFGYNPSSIKIQQKINLLYQDKKNISGIDVQVIPFNVGTSLQQPCRLNFILILFLSIFLFVWENSNYLMILVEEKKSGLKIYLQVMGFRQYQLKLASLVFPLLMHFIVIVLVTCFFYIPMKSSDPENIKSGSYTLQFIGGGVFFFHLILSAINLTNFQFFLSVFFMNESYASIISILLMFVPPFALFGSLTVFSSISIHLNRFTCLIPSLCMTKGFILLFDFEVYSKKTSLTEKLGPDDEALTILDFFMMNKSYWKERKRGSLVETGTLETTEQNKDAFEQVPANAKEAITVKNVTKKYRNGVVALDNVSITFYEGEIVGLLGHNGAGKTTLFSILCGMTTATKGEVTVQGYDIKDARHRANIGYCPQYDILLKATVRQNIIFFGMAKGLSWKEAKREAKVIIPRLGMEKEARVRATKLSGGQKRKLSLAVALSGNSQVILLDEPTTGIDAIMRRQIWNIILELRGNKTVVLCTHLLEEADALCNRIAVLGQGKIHTYGSPMFLKSKYGTGFSLSIVATNKSQANSITNLVKKYVKAAEFKYQNRLTLVFSLPEKELGNFPSLFEDLDDKKGQKEIVSYSLTVSTMEDVFLNINSKLKEELLAGKTKSETVVKDDLDEEYEKKKLTGCKLFGMQLYALFLKKIVYIRRNYLAYTISFIFFLILQTVITYLLSADSTNEVMSNTLDSYGQPEVLYSIDTSNTKIIDSFDKVIRRSGATFRKVSNITTGLSKLYIEGYQKYLKAMIGIEFYDDVIIVRYLENAQNAVPIIIDLVCNAFLYPNGSYVKSSLSYESFKKNVDYFAKCVFMILDFIFLLFLEERRTEVKTLQLLLVNPVSYWLSHLIFDLILLMLYCVICLSLMAALSDEFAAVISNNITCIALMLRMVVPETKVLKYFSPSTLWLVQFVEFCSPGFTEGENPHYGFGMYCLVAFIILILTDMGILQKLFHRFFTYLLMGLFIVRFKYQHPKDETVEEEELLVKEIVKKK